MPSQDCGLSVRSIAELALVVSRVSRSVFDEFAIPSSTSLRMFWQSSRSLEHSWLTILDRWTASQTFDVAVLERLAPRIFASEMLVRTWGTVLARLDLQEGRHDLTNVMRNCVTGLLHIRNGLLSRLLLVPEAETNRILNVDRLRRRCDRWTDLLIGPIAINSGSFEFAFDQERARDFADESLNADSSTGANAVEHLVSAGLRLSFIQHLPIEPIDEPGFVGLTQSILSSIPNRALHRDGSSRTLLEQRIATSRKRLECRAEFQRIDEEEMPTPQMLVSNISKHFKR